MKIDSTELCVEGEERDKGLMNLADELRERGKDLQIYLKDIEERLNKDTNENYKSMMDNYEFFQDMAHQILTGDGETSLRGQKTKVTEGKTITKYSADDEEYKTEEYGFFVNKQQFGKHYKPINTRKKLRHMTPMEFLVFMGKYKEEIKETLSGYFNKCEKAMRMADLIRKYDYHIEPPKNYTKEKIKVVGNKKTLVSASNKTENAYLDNRYSMEFHTYDVKELEFKTKEAASRSPWSKSNTNKLKVVYEGDIENEERYVKNIDYDMNPEDLLRLVDLVDESKMVIEKTLESRNREMERFDEFIEEFKKEFKNEIIAIRL